MLLLKPHDQPVGRGRKKTQGRFDPKKFFLTFLCWGDLRVFFKTKEKFFWWKNFFEKIFFLKFLRKKFWNFWKNLGFAILFLYIFRENKRKNAVKISFLAGPNQKLHTGAFDAGDQTPARWISIRCSETGRKNLLFSVKSFQITKKLWYSTIDQY